MKLKLKLKLFINKNTRKVVYAEAGKDFVDHLVHTFKMPQGHAMKEIFPGFVPGGLANLYTSLANLNSDNLLEGRITKDTFLNLRVLGTLYSCRSCGHDVQSKLPLVKCPCTCRGKLDATTIFENDPDEFKPQMGDGHVKAGITFLIMDDLTVEPLSSSRISITLPVKDLGRILEHEITVSKSKIRNMVKASLTSNTVLTDTFFRPLQEDEP